MLKVAILFLELLQASLFAKFGELPDLASRLPKMANLGAILEVLLTKFAKMASEHGHKGVRN